ncbi:MAG: hypothetical protein WD738_21370 [Pirellulales bacterium]
MAATTTKPRKTSSTKPRNRTSTLSIIDAIRDPNLFLSFFDGDLSTWRKWLVILRAIYGLPIRSRFGGQVIRDVTGRDPAKLNPDGYQTSLLLCGRRSGKSRIAAVISAYSAALAGLESKLAPGEQGLIAVVSPTRVQGRIVRNYIRALYNEPMLRQEIVQERTNDAFQLRSGNRLELLASDYRSVRGFTLLAVVVDEICFMGLDSSSRVRTDQQLVESLSPALATTNGKMICISSPYGKTGWAYRTWQKHFGNDNSQDVLVINAASRTLNPTLPQRIINRAMQEDLAAAKSEYLAEWRDDVSTFVPLELVERLVVKHRKENMPRAGNKYFAFVDLSGGRGDASALAIAHKQGSKVVLDALDYHPSPHNPFEVVAAMAERLQEFGVRRVVGDAYSAEFAASAFSNKGVLYTKCEKTKSALYADLLPVLCAGDIELLDHDRLVKQLSTLERRTRAGGKDVIDHPPKAHDDLSNAVAGVAHLASAKRLIAGAFRFN